METGVKLRSTSGGAPPELGPEWEYAPPGDAAPDTDPADSEARPFGNAEGAEGPAGGAPDADTGEGGEASAGDAEAGEGAAARETGLPSQGAGMPAAEREPYFGSVKFFKNLILLVVLLAIATPTVFSLCLWRMEKRGAAETARQAAELTELRTQYDALSADLTEREALWGSSMAGQALGSAQAAAYQELYPDFYVSDPPGTTVADDGTMYLTFDDGPSSNTPLLLSILDSEDVKATFFVVGGASEKQRQWMRDIADAGHTLGMHSYTHDYHRIYESVESFLDDYYKLYTAIREATGAAPTVFRFPGGSVNSYNYPVYREIIAEMLRRGFVFYDWNISSGDASSRYISPERIIENVLNDASYYKRGIVLFHDAAAKDSTVESLTGVIHGLRDMGFTFAPLSREVRPIIFNYEDYQID